ncbi:MAG: LysR family transcriptional regulator [Burkholderiales bacterium]|nr:LysR family transcriptional regulator [Burkholderiales bacterium]
MKNLPSLRHLMGFEAAARHGNFSRAAQELCLSQSAISHQVQQLEEQLDQPLFHRVGRGVELTMAGEVLLLAVQKSLTTLETGLQRIATYMAPGLVVVVAPAALMQGWIAPQMEAAQEADPQLLPVLSTDETARFIDEVDVDIHISNRPLQQADLHEQVLFRDVYLVVAAKVLAAKLMGQQLPQQYALAGMLCLEKSLSDDLLGPLMRDELAGFRKLAIYDDMRLLLDALRRGRGVACVPYSAIASELASGQIQVLPGYRQVAGETWWIARASGATRSPHVVQVFDALCAAASEIVPISTTQF